MWSFRPKVDSPEVASSALVKVDSTDDNQHFTTPVSYTHLTLPTSDLV